MKTSPPFRRLRHRLALVAILLGWPLSSGCVAIAAAGVVGVGLVQYERNEFEHQYPASLEVTWKATLEALHRLEITAAAATVSGMEGRIEHQDLVLLVESLPEGQTRVRVRIGRFHTPDHQRRGELILAEIDRVMAEDDELRGWTEKAEELTGSGDPPEPDAPE